MRNPSPTWIAFLAITIGIVGMTGVFATYGAPLALQRALARDATLDAAQVAAHGPNATAALEALRVPLDDSAAAILPAGPDIDAKITQERAAMRARFTAEADATAARLRFLICVVTVMAAVFGAVVMRLSARASG